MSRTPDIFKPRIDEYFVELFGEQYLEDEVYDAYVESFDTNAPDDGVFEGELQGEFEMLWYDEWAGQFDDRDDDFPEAAAEEVSAQMAQYVVDQMVGEEGKASINFRQSQEVMGSLRDLGSAWTQAAGEDSWYNAWIIVLPEASNMADEKQDEFLDEAEETVVGDAVEFTKDFIRDAYEESGEYADLMESLDIEGEGVYASTKKRRGRKFHIAGVTPMPKKAELDEQVRIYIADLAAYNEGRLVGEWVDLPADEEELEEIVDRLTHGGTQDYAIHDYEAPFQIGEYDSPFKLNEMVQQLEDADINFEILACVKDNLGYDDWESAISYAEEAGAIDISDRYGSRPHNPEEQLAYYFVEEVDGGIQNLPEETVEQYFDYEKFGRDRSTELYEEIDEEYYEQFSSDREYGEAIVDDFGGVFNATSNPEYYFDYARYGRDLAYDYFLCGNYYIRSM